MKIHNPQFVAQTAPSDGGTGVTGPTSPTGPPQEPSTPPQRDSAPPAEPKPRLPFVRPGEEPEDGGAGPRRPPQNNHIPYDRHQKILEKAVADAVTARDAEYQPFFQQISERLQQLQQQPDRADLVRKMLAAAGLMEDPQAQAEQAPLTRAEFMRAMAQQQQQFGSALKLQQAQESARSTLEAAKQRHAEYFADDPLLEQRVIDLWGSSDDSIQKVIEDEMKRIDALYDARTRRYAQQKAEDGRRVPARPSGAPAPRGGAKPALDLSTEEGANAALDEILSEDEG